MNHHILHCRTPQIWRDVMAEKHFSLLRKEEGKKENKQTKLTLQRMFHIFQTSILVPKPSQTDKNTYHFGDIHKSAAFTLVDKPIHLIPYSSWSSNMVSGPTPQIYFIPPLVHIKSVDITRMISPKHCHHLCFGGTESLHEYWVFNITRWFVAFENPLHLPLAGFGGRSGVGYFDARFLMPLPWKSGVRITIQGGMERPFYVFI